MWLTSTTEQLVKLNRSRDEFYPTPKQVPTMDIVAGVEQGLSIARQLVPLTFISLFTRYYMLQNTQLQPKQR